MDEPPAHLELVRADLIRIRDVLEDLTGLRSRWTGEVILHAASEVQYRGKKEPACAISLREDTVADPVARWPVLLHKSLHALSVGNTPEAYRFAREWEEGVVEEVQRLLRPRVLQALGENIPDDRFRAVDRLSRYNEHIRRLEAVREVLGEPLEDFYLRLLRIPLSARPRLALEAAERLRIQHGREGLR